jgi:hypothetical protein
MKRTIVKGAGCAAVGLLLAACGGGDSPAPTGRSMSASGAPAGGVNNPPRLERVALDPETPRAGDEVIVRVQAADPDGDAIELQYSWTLDGRRVAERGASFRVPDSARKNTPITVEVTAHDGRTGSAPATAQARVANRSPELLGVRIEPFEGVKVGSELVAVVEGRDADDDRLEFSYEWRVNGRPVEERAERFVTSGLKRGDEVRVRVTASDGSTDTPPLDSAGVALGNSAPAITSTPGGVTNDGQFRYAVQASDPDGDRNLRFRLAQGPEGAQVDPLLGEVTWSATRAHVGKHGFEVVVEDGHGGEAHQKFEVDVSEVEVSQGDPADAPVASIE